MWSKTQKKGSGFQRNFLQNHKKSLKFFNLFFTFNFGIFIGISVALANPTGGQVSAGQANIIQAPNNTTINQTTQKAIINWQSFNINRYESTHFQQPSGGMTLNRINPTQGASQIYGTLTATGQIVLVNPAGVFFGPSAYVNVGGMIATTANITDQNFLNNNFQFAHSPDYSGAVTNQGTIIAADHGLIALVGSSVTNTGMIKANLGRIVLASGDAYTMSFDNNHLINFTITAPSRNASRVSNTGSLIANGGQILVTSKAARGVLDNSINMEGMVQVRSVGVHQGELILSGDPNGSKVYVAANIDATGKKSGEKGGKVAITGHDILLNSPTIIDVSGDMGGGNIYVGGNFQGRGPLPNAHGVIVAPGVNLIADAMTKGKGGNVIIWSDHATKFYGNIFARGGQTAGDGGFVEVSGKNNLAFFGKVNTHAQNGNTGTLLLDPLDLYIIEGSAGTGDQDTPLLNAGGSIDFNTLDTANNTISVGQLQDLGDTNITLQAQNSLTVGDINGASANVDLTSTLFSNTLTLQAGDAVTAGGGNIIFNTGSSINTGGGHVNIIAGDATRQTGNVTLGAINTSGGNISVTAQAGITQLADTVVNSGSGALTLNAGNQTLTTNNNSQLLSTGTITLIADHMALSGAGLAQVGGTDTSSDFATNVIIRPFTSGTSIGIAGGAGTLALSTSALAKIRALDIRIGDSASGAITLGTWTPVNSFAPNGILTLASGNTITQTGALNLATSGASLLLRDSSGVTLNNGNVIRNVAALISGSLSITNAANNLLTVTALTDDFGTVNGITAPNGVTLTSSGTGGLLRINQNIHTTNSTISLTGNGITQAGNTIINAGTGGITLNAGSNAITTGSSSRLFSTGNIALIGNSLLLSTLGTAQIGGDGSGTSTDFAANVMLRQNTNGTSINIAGGGGTINLTANILNTIHSNNVQIGDNNSGAIRIGAWTPVSSFARNGTLTLVSGTTISQTGAINLAASGSSLLLRNASGVTLTNSGNVLSNIAANIDGALSITNSSAQPLTIASLTDSLGTVNGITTAGNINLTATNSAITEAGAAVISGNLLTLSAASGISLNNVNTVSNLNISNTGSGDVSFTNNGALAIAGITQTVGNLSITNNGAITQSGAIISNGVGTTASFAAGSLNNITLADSANDFATFRVLNGNNVSVADANAIDLGASTVSGNLNINTNGMITQTGAINTPSLIISSLGGITLNQASNNILSFNAINNTGDINFTNAANLNLTGIVQNGGGNVTVNNTGALNITGSINTAGNINLTANGAITEAGAAVISGNLLTLSAASGISLNNVNTVSNLNISNTGSGDVSFTNNGALAITGITQTVGNLSITNNGAIAQIGSIISNGIGTTASFAAGSSNNITLTNSNNDFATFRVLNGNNVSVTDANAIDLGASTVLGNLNINTNGAITQTGAINTSSLIISSLGGITLNQASNNILSFNAINNTGDINFTNAANINLTGIVQNGGGDIAINNTGALNITGAIEADGGDITFNSISPNVISLGANISTQNGVINFNSPVNLLASLVINAGNGAINFANTLSGANQTLTLQNNIAAAGTVTFNGNISLDNLITFAQPYSVIMNGSNNTFTNAITFNNTNGVTLGNGSNNIFNFNGGLNNTASTTTIHATVNTNNTAMTFDSMILAGDTVLNTSGGHLTMGSITGGQDLTLNTGSMGDIIFNGDAALGDVNIISAHDITNNANIFAANFLAQFANIIDLGNLLTTNNTDLTANNVFGELHTGSLTLNVLAANLLGTVDGLSDESAISLIELVNTIGPGTHFLNAIDMYITPIAPTPTPSPSSNNLAANTNTNNTNNNVLLPELFANLPGEINTVSSTPVIDNQVNFLGGTGGGISGFTESTNQSGGGAAGTGTGAESGSSIGSTTNTTSTTNSFMSNISNTIMNPGSFAQFINNPQFNFLNFLNRTAKTMQDNFIQLLLLTLLAGTTMIALSKMLLKKKQDDISELSFNLRTSLNDIMGFSALMYEGKAGSLLSAAQKEYINDILAGSDNILQIINQLPEQNNQVLNFIKTKEFLKEQSFTMRTALNDIIGFAELMYNNMIGNVSVEQREYLGSIVMSSNHLLRQIEAQPI
jgi:filamentous hemagglutinin family protein